MKDAEMIGTGRMNLTGGSGTITLPKKAVELWGVDENGLDIVWFYDGIRLFAARQSDVGVQE